MRDSFRTRSTLTVGKSSYELYSLRKLAEHFPDLVKLPFSLKILLENLLRREDATTVKADDIRGLASARATTNNTDQEVLFLPARVLLQDFTGVPAIADLAAMREAMIRLGGSSERINPLQPVDLVVDHSVQVDRFGSNTAFRYNVDREMARNRERYVFLRWGQGSLRNYRVVPPGTGICHQVNLEYLAHVVIADETGLAYPDTLVGTDSHTTMINGLGVFGFGVGGIEAEAAMLGQPITMLVPRVVGFKLHGRMPQGVTATDLVLTITQQLRRHGVVNKVVEFYGPGVTSLALADRATIANMAPEYGATMGFFGVDAETIDYLRLTNRPIELVDLVAAYCEEQGLWRADDMLEPQFAETLELDLASVGASVAGPRRPQDRVPLKEMPAAVRQAISETLQQRTPASKHEPRARIDIENNGTTLHLGHGDVVIAAITSCTNTSNPAVMLGAGLLAQKAVQRGLMTKPWVKTSLAPGSKAVSGYLAKAGVTPYLEALGFHLVGYGCTTCIGNSGPLPKEVSAAIDRGDLIVASVLSGNRNFEGRINPQVRMSFLASPPLVVAYALAGRADIDFEREPVGLDRNGEAVFLHDIWPSSEEINASLRSAVGREQFKNAYSNVTSGDAAWRELDVPVGATYPWNPASTYIRRPPFFDRVERTEPAPQAIAGARVLAWFGDSITTDHISPAGSIAQASPAARYLEEHGVLPADFNSYGARRGNHEVMMRGTFANPRIRNRLVPDREGGLTVYWPTRETLTIYDAAMKYRADGTALIVIAGGEYGTGSSRDWAAKGPALLGVRAVIAKSFERIHRSNLVGMGILPLQFLPGEDADSLGLDGSETYDVVGSEGALVPKQQLRVRVSDANKETREFAVIVRIDTLNELDYLRHDGILPFVLRQLLAAK